MRLSWLVLLLLAGTARADQKLLSFKPEFVRESTGCQVHLSGLTKVLSGATDLAKSADPAERDDLSRDADQLTKGIALVKEYCDELTGVITFIDTNATAPYASIQRELDVRYNKILKLRTSSKKTIEDLQPITRKLIPRMTRPQSPPSEPRRIPGKFPSGRTIDLPSLPGSWRLSGSSTSDTAIYSESPPKGPAVSATATTRPFSGSCDDQRKSLLVRGDAEQLSDLPLPKDLPLAWASRYTRREQATSHLVTVLCLPAKSGILLATADVSPADRAPLADELTSLLLRMLAAQKP
jgi:hypothetical protein